MITIYFDECTSFMDRIGSYEVYYRDNMEISEILKRLDIDYEPDGEAESRFQDAYENSKTAVTIRGDARVIDQLVEALRGGYDDILQPWIQGDPWFLSEAVDLSDMDAQDTKFLLEKYGDSIPEDLRVGLFADLAAAA